MWTALVRWVTENSGITVILCMAALLLVTSVIAIAWAAFVRPKIRQVDDLLQRVSVAEQTLKLADLGTLASNVVTMQANLKTLQDAKFAESIATLDSRIAVLENVRNAERLLMDERNNAFQDAVGRSIEEMRQLLKRSEMAIQEQLGDKQDAWVMEQIDQDVKLAEITERLARMLSQEQHAEAVDALKSAKARRDAARANTAPRRTTDGPAASGNGSNGRRPGPPDDVGRKGIEFRPDQG
ncbi:hypothetical protein ACFJIW_17790 [Tahibacter sp. UC22_41]|uniref:hypothetical protein n=1 Tax=Tahibacter sp. UC22_41 TaxID=3350178 RepID=UPI0036DE785B